MQMHSLTHKHKQTSELLLKFTFDWIFVGVFGVAREVNDETKWNETKNDGNDGDDCDDDDDDGDDDDND